MSAAAALRAAVAWLFRNRKEIAEVVHEVVTPAEPSNPVSHADVEHIRRQQASAVQPKRKP